MMSDQVLNSYWLGAFGVMKKTFNAEVEKSGSLGVNISLREDAKAFTTLNLNVFGSVFSVSGTMQLPVGKFIIAPNRFFSI